MAVQHTAAGRAAVPGLCLAGIPSQRGLRDALRKLDDSRRPSHLWLRGLCALVVLSGCTPLSERTQVQVSIDAEPVLRPRISSVDVDLRLGADVDRGHVTRTEHLSAANSSWPLRLVLAPTDPHDGRYQLSAYARGADDKPIAVAKASSAFVEGRTLELGLRFDAQCADRAEDCPDQQSCQGGQCMSAFVPPESLPGGETPAMVTEKAAADGGTPPALGGGGCVGAGCAAAASCPEGFVSLPDHSCAPAPLALTVEGARLEPTFRAELSDYRVALPLGAEQVNLRVSAAPGVQLAIEGRALASGELWTTAAPAFGDERAVTVALSMDGHGRRELRLTLAREGEVLGYLKASNAGAGDELGRVIAASGDTLVVGAPLEDGSVRSTAQEPDDGVKDAGAVYVFVRDASGAYRQQAYLKAEAPRESAQFGISVAIEGDRLVVGAVGDGAGAAHVFERQNGAWSRVKVLLPDAVGGSVQKYGAAVALQGDTVVIGASTETSQVTESGAIYVYERGNGDYANVVKLKAKVPGPLDWLGASVSIANDVLVSATTGEIPNGYVSSGVLHVFTRGASGWAETQTILPAEATACAFFGAMMVVSGNTIAASCWNPGSERPAGAVYLYERGADGMFAKGSVITSSAAQSGDLFGRAIALSGDTMLVGAPGERSAARGIGGREMGMLEGSGAAYLFTRQGGAWHEVVRIKAPQPFAQDGVGGSVAFGADGVLYVGANLDACGGSGVSAAQDVRGAASSGAVHVFR